MSSEGSVVGVDTGWSDAGDTECQRCTHSGVNMPLKQRVIFFLARLCISVAYITAIASALCWLDAPRKAPQKDNSSSSALRPVATGWTLPRACSTFSR